MNTIFVTGGAGYVGSHCCKQFAEGGWKVVVYDNLRRGWADAVQWGDLVEGDILDQERLQSAVAQAKPDVIAHFAALAYVGESVTNPDIYYETNVVGSLNVLNAMRGAGVDKLILSSSCATYGVPKQMPISETHPQAPINPYGWSKLMMERMAIDYAAAYGMNYVILRYFNAAGASGDGDIGERHEPETHVVPLAMQGALSSDYEFTIFGDDFETRDGTCLRDYIHVSDLAQAHAAAAAYLLRQGSSEILNLGTGRGTTVGEIADAVEEVAGKPLARHIGPRRPGDPGSLVASYEKARTLLGWEPRESSIEQIVRSAWAWARRSHPMS